MQNPDLAADPPLTRHAFLGDLEGLVGELRSEAAQRSFLVVEAVGEEEIPVLGIAVTEFAELLDQVDRVGDGVLYLLADDDLGEIDDPPEFIESLRDSMPEATTPEEEEGVQAMHASLDRLESLYERLGAASYRVGYLRQGILHHLLLEDEAAAPAAAIAELMIMEAGMGGFDEDGPADLGIDPDLTRR